MTDQTATPVTPRLSATVMLLRDQPDGLEVFMVVRHRQIEFASGAVVFPGGSPKTDPLAVAKLRNGAHGPPSGPGGGISSLFPPRGR